MIRRVYIFSCCVILLSCSSSPTKTENPSCGCGSQVVNEADSTQSIVETQALEPRIVQENQATNKQYVPLLLSQDPESFVNFGENNALLLKKASRNERANLRLIAPFKKIKRNKLLIKNFPSKQLILDSNNLYVVKP